METEAKPKAEESHLDHLDFCPGCFATDEDGSWGCTVIGDYCMNCGAGGTVRIPRWAVKSIRRQASWVGKRYYPNDEDFERHAELKALRALPASFPGRTTEQDQQDPNRFWVKQKLTDNKSVSISVVASSHHEAMEASRFSLPYVPEVPPKDDGKADSICLTETRG
jgi:hypothetical protein